MKKVLVLFVLVIGSIAGLLFAYGVMRNERDVEAAAEAPVVAPSRIEQGANGARILNLDDETQKRLGLRTALPSADSILVELTAPARVLNGAGLAASLNQLHSAQAALEAARADHERKKKLFEKDQNASATAVEQAEVLLRQQQLAVAALNDSILGTWGQALAKREDLSALSRLLLQRQAALVRIDLLASDSSVKPMGIRLLRHNGEEIATAELLGLAPATDSVVAGESLLALVTTNAVSLVPGSAVVAQLAIGSSEQGTLLPRAAVIRHAGSGWAYVKTSDDQFARRIVTLDHPHPQGWLVSGDWKDPVVVEGAQSLLSEELKGDIQMKD